MNLYISAILSAAGSAAIFSLLMFFFADFRWTPTLLVFGSLALFRIWLGHQKRRK